LGRRFLADDMGILEARGDRWERAALAPGVSALSADAEGVFYGAENGLFRLGGAPELFLAICLARLASRMFALAPKPRLESLLSLSTLNRETTRANPLAASCSRDLRAPVKLCTQKSLPHGLNYHLLSRTGRPSSSRSPAWTV